jgi:hypoxanthine phosphoribosyltransferase
VVGVASLVFAYVLDRRMSASKALVDRLHHELGASRALTWERVQSGVSIIARELKRQDFMPDLLIGISKGGCVVADLLSIEIDRPMICINVLRSRQEQRAVREILNDRLGISLPDLSQSNVLIVDDYEGCGATMTLARQYVEAANPKAVKTACVWSCNDPRDRYHDPDIIAHDMMVHPSSVPWGIILLR